jgi:hypothetical protein
MTVHLRELEGIHPGLVQAFESFNVKTTDDLIELYTDDFRKRAFEEKTGVSPSFIEKWVRRASLLRVEGVTPKLVELLAAVGVDSVAKLKSTPADELARQLTEAAGSDTAPAQPPVPSATDVARWVEDSQALTPLFKG